MGKFDSRDQFMELQRSPTFSTPCQRQEQPLWLLRKKGLHVISPYAASPESAVPRTELEGRRLASASPTRSLSPRKSKLLGPVHGITMYDPALFDAAAARSRSALQGHPKALSNATNFSRTAPLYRQGASEAVPGPVGTHEQWHGAWVVDKDSPLTPGEVPAAGGGAGTHGVGLGLGLHPGLKSIARFGPRAGATSPAKRVAFPAGGAISSESGTEAMTESRSSPMLNVSLHFPAGANLAELPLMRGAASHRRLDAMNRFSESLSACNVAAMKLRVFGDGRHPLARSASPPRSPAGGSPRRFRV